MSTGEAHTATVIDESRYTRFRALFGRDPDDGELSVFEHTRQALVLRLPAHARRRTARVIARL